MSTFSQLMTQRAMAGAAYASAVDALKTAYINLAALDRTMENRNVAAGYPMSGDPVGYVAGFLPNPGVPAPVLSFLRDKSAVVELVRLLLHTEFTPGLKHQNWHAQIETASNLQIASFTLS